MAMAIDSQFDLSVANGFWVLYSIYYYNIIILPFANLQGKVPT